MKPGDAPGGAPGGAGDGSGALPPRGAPLVEAEGVHYAHRGAAAGAARLPALRGVTVSLLRGELLGVLGPNGAGKSTLLRLMAGLARPSAGSVRVLGEEASAARRRRRLALALALVPQAEPAAFAFTAREVVAMGRAPHTGLFGALSARDERAVGAALARCDAAHLAARPVGELSGGEYKRVLIARALAQETPVLLLDEPAASLDVRHQLEVCELLAGGVASGEFSVGSSRVDLQACKLEYSIVSPK